MAVKKRRAAWSRVVAVIFALLLPLCAISVWAITTVTNTDRWVATLHPLATNRTVTNYIGQQGAQAIVNQLHVQSRIEKVLPASASILVPTITATIQSTIEKALDDALASQEFSKFWDRINRATHAVAVNILNGTYNGKINKAHDLVLNVSPALIKAIDQLDARGITYLDPIKKEISQDRIASLKLLSQKELSKVQRYYQIANTLRWVLPLFMIALGAVVILLARPFREGARRLAIALTISSAVTYVLLKVALSVASGLSSTPPDVSKAILDTLTSFLSSELITLTLVGVIALVVIWFTGHGERARGTRHWLAMNARAMGRAVTRESKDLRDGELVEWTHAHRDQLRLGLAAGNVVIYGLVLIATFTIVDSVWGLIVLALIGVLWWVVSRRLKTALEPATPVDQGDVAELGPGQPGEPVTASGGSDATTTQ